MTPKEALAKAADALKNAEATAIREEECRSWLGIADRWITIAGTLLTLKLDPTNVQNYPALGEMDRLEDGR